MFVDVLESVHLKCYYKFKEFRTGVFAIFIGGDYMDNESYKKYIIEMVQKIDNNKYLERIYNYVHKYFIRRTGK